jgi:hypothetical protein
MPGIFSCSRLYSWMNTNMYVQTDVIYGMPTDQKMWSPYLAVV